MHFEILVEDTSGRIALEHLVAKILGPNGFPHTYRITSYKGVGRLPKGLRPTSDPRKRVLLDQLPRLLRGFGKSLRGFSAAVLVVVDLDTRVCMQFKQELLNLLHECDPAPVTLFRIAIEEVEAWFLGDRQAVKAAYPNANDRVLSSYEQDSICGTWERLADAVYPGGSVRLKQKGYPLVGQVKCEWAERIAPHVDVERNHSKSFQVFRTGLLRLAANDE